MAQFTIHLHDITYVIIYYIYNCIITNKCLQFLWKNCMLSSKCNKCNKSTDLHHKSKIQNHNTRITQTKHYTQQQHLSPHD